MIQYPTNMYDTVKVTFNKELNESERERAVNIARYWGQIYPNGQFQSSHMSDGNTLFISIKERDCSKRHNPLENLATFLQEGTKVKVRDGQRTYEGLGGVINSVRGL